ncbi:NAD-dependent epimerase/dehydratase family protein [Actinomadura madurae]|uniref:NAD-dependent epimerase/dehydratase family protein n=1 Tax=Actinomadura madurae TaxID=1993 RepID=UPI00202712AA|nr:NAD-dependent epimerase/dehydratase family protein [Actinomadura madurae]MCP9953328.1 NAD-dependent epimerase/dehydratase family protein [Actinomadura madurae]MCP9970088.1 NAD-dependent epimerase/dehydratase family protein [Actinomadura madurae]MCP9982549.1 NAD-dependent epimerase/dehydratase family protein [Actinomadura madurae]MCQ0005914.1 NAD-dependent epimerase/dehydratase family protein [Actinomadura madurae]MCQ0018796.1 NAD-dependent epimerase/dehydratase family protein [Actinomadura 
MRVVVTGAAGFIGSHVAEALSGAGHEVLAVDAPERSLAPEVARRTWARVAAGPGVVAAEIDLAVDALDGVAAADVVVHLAGRPGVRDSWGPGRAVAERDNVRATRRLLEACLRRPAGLRPKVVVASSSSVYGTAGTRPNREDDPLNPASPYAASKVEVERLAGQAAGGGLRTVLLRYFSVYGPRQRPDMAFHRFVEAALDGRPLPVFGDGRGSRSFTHVRDVVAATLAAAAADLPPGIAVNVGHREHVAVRDAIALLTRTLGVRTEIRRETPVAGDAARTWADTTRAEELLGWTATTGLAEGLAEQIAWQRGRRTVPERAGVG